MVNLIGWNKCAIIGLSDNWVLYLEMDYLNMWHNAWIYYHVYLFKDVTFIKKCTQVKAHNALNFSWLLPRIIIIISISCLCITSCPFLELSCTVFWYWIMYEVREIYNAEAFDLSLDFVVKNCRVQLHFLCLTLWYQRYSLCHLAKRISC